MKPSITAIYPKELSSQRRNVSNRAVNTFCLSLEIGIKFANHDACVVGIFLMQSNEMEAI
jgi:hypothetical protein